MARNFLPLEQQHGNVEHVPALQLRVLRDVALHEPRPQGGQRALDDLAHLRAEAAVRLAQEDEDGRPGQEGTRPFVIGRLHIVARPAPAITITIRSCTARPVRSAWIPSEGTSGKGTGRGRR
jgi:hypothetical protein